MSTLLHLSFRVRDPQRSAELYAALLDGEEAPGTGSGIATLCVDRCPAPHIPYTGSSERQLCGGF